VAAPAALPSEVSGRCRHRYSSARSDTHRKIRCDPRSLVPRSTPRILLAWNVTHGYARTRERPGARRAPRGLHGVSNRSRTKKPAGCFSSRAERGGIARPTIRRASSCPPVGRRARLSDQLSKVDPAPQPRKPPSSRWIVALRWATPLPSSISGPSPSDEAVRPVLVRPANARAQQRSAVRLSRKAAGIAAVRGGLAPPSSCRASMPLLAQEAHWWASRESSGRRPAGRLPQLRGLRRAASNPDPHPARGGHGPSSHGPRFWNLGPKELVRVRAGPRALPRRPPPRFRPRGAAGVAATARPPL